MRIKLGLFKYNLEPDDLRVMIQVEKMAKKPIYEIGETLHDQLIYIFCMFRGAGFRLGWIIFTILLTPDVMDEIFKQYQDEIREREKKVESGENPGKSKTDEKVSAHEMLMQFSLI